MASMDDDMDPHSPLTPTITVMRSPAADRNKDVLLQVLKQLVQNQELFALEVASGTGQHVAHFSQHLPNVTWQPSECDHKSMLSIQGYIAASQLKNLREPVWIDTIQPVEEWANGVLAPTSCDLILCINMIHISECAATEGLFRGCGHYLKPDGMLFTYGPYMVKGEIYPESNVQFDRMLKQQCSDWGLRDTAELEKLAEANGLEFEKMMDMPSNNKVLIYRRKKS